MKPEFFFLVTFLLLAPATQAAEDQTERIRALEERVAYLETALRELTGKQLPQPVAEPQPKPSAPTTSIKPRFEMPPELVPEIGKIGAEVGLLISGSSSPF